MAQTPSPHSNRLAVRISDPAVFRVPPRLLRGVSQRDGVPTVAGTVLSGRWHTPEQAAGLMDACRHGRSELWFEYFFTPRHARLFAASTRLPGAEAKHPIPVARTRTPPRHIDITHRWGMSLTAVADSPKLTTQRERSIQPSPLHDDHENAGIFNAPARLGARAAAFRRCVPRLPRLAMRCPGVLYRNNGTHWNFDKAVAAVRGAGLVIYRERDTDEVHGLGAPWCIEKGVHPYKIMFVKVTLVVCANPIPATDAASQSDSHLICKHPTPGPLPGTRQM